MGSATVKTVKKLSDVTSLDGYDFVDLGAGDGGSLVSIQKILGGRGLGIEMDGKKVKKAAGLGRDVVLGNALDLHKLKGKVDYATCDNFLEHLLSFDDVDKMLEQAVGIARKFVYIRHPSFEDNEYLAGLGLKTYWSDWHGHTSMLKVSDIVDMLRKHGVYMYKILPVSLIKESDDDRIIPLEAPIDQHGYKLEHGPKPKPAIIFDHDVYYAFDIIGILPGAESSVPQLAYSDRLGLDKRPKFLHEEDERVKRIIDLERQLQILKGRKSVRLADWAGSKIDAAKIYAGAIRSKLQTGKTIKSRD